jgi:hypothetical protein
MNLNLNISIFVEIKLQYNSNTITQLQKYQIKSTSLLHDGASIKLLEIAITEVRLSSNKRK